VRVALPSPKLGDVDRRGLSPLFQSAPHLAGTLATSAEAVVVSSSSHGISRLSPLHWSTIRASTPGSSEELPSGRRYHPTTPVPSSWSLTTSTASSARRLQVCCTPLPVIRFASFPQTPYPAFTRRFDWPLGPGFSRRGSYPSKGSPRQQPFRITAVVALISLDANLLARA
jgi:hypothetical protein